MQIQANPDQIRYTASLFSAGANELRQKAKQLGNLLYELLDGPRGWSGEAAQSFCKSVERIHNEIGQKAGVLEEAVQILNQFALQMDNVNQMRNEVKNLESSLWSISGDSEAAFHERQSISYQINQLQQEADWQANAADAQATSAFHSLSIPMISGDQEHSNQSLLADIGQKFKDAFDFIGGAVYAIVDDLSMGILDQVIDDHADQRSESYQEGKVIGDEISIGVGVVTAVDGLIEAIGGAGAGAIFSETGVGLVVGGAIAVEGVVQAAGGVAESFYSYSKLEDDKMMLSKNQEEDSQGNQSASEPNPVEVEYGDHFTTDGKKKVLKPNIKYTTPEGYTYTTDEKGRISSVEGKLELGTAKRNPYAQRTVGGEDRLPSDHGGHLIATIFKGSGEIDNLVPMDANLNWGDYKSLENEWKMAMTHGKEVQVNVAPLYKEDSQRPVAFNVEYTIDGMKKRQFLRNSSGGRK